MAERRMVSKVISISEKVNSLSLFGRLLYTWMIPHTDDFGRLPGSPAKIRALVVPMGDEGIKDVEQALEAMAAGDLIVWYEVSGERYIQIVNFDDHQSGLHKRTKSKFPEPPEKVREEMEASGEFPESSEVEPDIPGTSGNLPGIPPELELELEPNRTTTTTTTTTGAGAESTLPVDTNFGDLFREYQKHFLGDSKITQYDAEDFQDLYDTYSGDWVKRAMREAYRQGPDKRNLAYVHGVLKGYRERGGPDSERASPPDSTRETGRHSRPIRQSRQEMQNEQLMREIQEADQIDRNRREEIIPDHQQHLPQFPD